MTEAQVLRKAILEAKLETSNYGEAPQLGTLYLPPSHLKALRLDASVVVGGRGVGKSFWTSALQSAELRSLIRAESSELANIDEVRAGFATAESIGNYPKSDVFTNFLANDGDPYDLWRAVLLRWVAQRAGQSIPNQSWPETVAWLKSDPESAARLMQRPRDWRGLILFDALDRTSSEWDRMDKIVRGLLQMLLWLKSYPGLYAKVFLREDQAARNVFNFPDASKLISTKTELAWMRHDLHGMLWQRLINAPASHGEKLRTICKSEYRDNMWFVEPEMKVESDTQRRAFEMLAGPWMGRDKRRGIPYTWSVGHLADGRGLTSPRSFLAAILQATEDSELRYGQYEFALHYESIKRGIQKASEIRVQEIAEDYPWAPELLSALKGTIVPCEYETVLGTWEARFPNGPDSVRSDKKLPAQHAERGWDGIKEDLQRLGLMETKKDGRIDMPDLYRVGFGLGRMGGVKPKA